MDKNCKLIEMNEQHTHTYISSYKCIHNRPTANKHFNYVALQKIFAAGVSKTLIIKLNVRFEPNLCLPLTCYLAHFRSKLETVLPCCNNMARFSCFVIEES